MTNKPFFSIITICFNSDDTIEKTIRSVLSQSYKNYEYIIVDGGSNDSTLDIINKLEPLFEGRLKCKSEPDNGIYNAMNKGIMRSTGDIIGIVNSDDWIEPNTLELISQQSDKSCLDEEVIYTGHLRFHYKTGRSIINKSSKERYKKLSKRYGMGLYHPSTFVSRSVYDKIGIYDEHYKLCADADFIIRCYKEKIKVVFIDAVLSNMLDGGASNQNSIKVLEDVLYKIKKHSSNRIEYILLYIKCYYDWLLRKIVPNKMIDLYRKIRK